MTFNWNIKSSLQSYLKLDWSRHSTKAIKITETQKPSRHQLKVNHPNSLLPSNVAFPPRSTSLHWQKTTCIPPATPKSISQVPRTYSKRQYFHFNDACVNKRAEWRTEFQLTTTQIFFSSSSSFVLFHISRFDFAKLIFLFTNFPPVDVSFITHSFCWRWRRNTFEKREEKNIIFSYLIKLNYQVCACCALLERYLLPFCVLHRMLFDGLSIINRKLFVVETGELIFITHIEDERGGIRGLTQRCDLRYFSHANSIIYPLWADYRKFTFWWTWKTSGKKYLIW